MRNNSQEFIFQVIGSLSFFAGVLFTAQENFHFLCRALTFGNVAGDSRSADNRTVFVENGRGSCPDIHQRAVFADANRFVICRSLTLSKPRQNSGFLVNPLGSNEYCDWFSNCFSRSVTKECLSAVVPGCDDAVEIFGDDPILG